MGNRTRLKIRLIVLPKTSASLTNWQNSFHGRNVENHLNGVQEKPRNVAD
jgi:hypothetical protein